MEFCLGLPHGEGEEELSSSRFYLLEASSNKQKKLMSLAKLAYMSPQNRSRETSRDSQKYPGRVPLPNNLKPNLFYNLNILSKSDVKDERHRITELVYHSYYRG